MQSKEVVITAESLSKSYLIGHEIGNHRGQESFREAVGRHARTFVHAAVNVAHGRQIIRGEEVEEFWALKDVSFEVRRGEVLGIIGRNGAGKSTLLKILSRITEPTRGRATIRGRVASLLEVGTGFHQDLTGRENIFLNGAILGMSKAEIKAKFDEIVGFAEVEKFLDTPVKHYSSGMYVRLAFAVAAHLQSEILIIDEVLAVGDISFQRKCLGKMQNVAHDGRTVIFVSHNMAAIVALTSRTMLIDGGRLVMAGANGEVVSSYLRSMQNELQAFGDVSAYRRSYRTEGYVDIDSVRICGHEPGVASIGLRDNLVVDIGLSVLRSFEQAIIVVNILNDQLEVLTSIVSSDSGLELSLEPGIHTIRCDVGILPLMPGYYRLSVGIAESQGILAWDVLEPLPGFRIEPTNDSDWLQTTDRPGVVLLDSCKWSQWSTMKYQS
jgi:lipopolysaccharide transport system ATP-binding protein